MSYKARCILSEAIVMILRRAGETAPRYVPDVVAACLPIIKREGDRQRSLRQQVNGEPCSASNADSFNKESTREESVTLRTTAVSLLAESIALAGWSAKAYLRDIIDIAIGILTLEREKTFGSILQDQMLSTRRYFYCLLTHEIYIFLIY